MRLTAQHLQPKRAACPMHGTGDTPCHSVAGVDASAGSETRHTLKTRRNRNHTMTEKTANVHWEGRGKQGQGKISTETGALKQYPYGFASRFEDDRRGTNPEEILGAAHDACFTMAFSFACDKAGLATTDVDT